MHWSKLIAYLSVFSPLLPLLTSIGIKPSKHHKIIILFVVLSFSADLTSLFYINVIYGNNMMFLHIYGLLEGLILIWFYSQVLDIKKSKIIIIAIIFTILYLINSFFLEFGDFNAIGRFFESVVVLLLSLYLFYQFYKNEDDIFLDRSPTFWFNAALLVYFAGAFFSFLLARLIELDSQMWIFHNTSNFLKNLLIAVGIWRIRRNY